MLLEKLNWRYATKKFDPARVVPQDKVDQIVEAARLAPTSSGLQPYELFVVTNPDVKAKILPLGYREANKDWLVNLKKVRRAREKFVTEIR